MEGECRQRPVFGEVSLLGLQIAELVYRLNLNVTVLLCPKVHTEMMSVDYLHVWMVSAGVSQHGHLSAQQSANLLPKSQQVPSVVPFVIL